MISSLAQCSLEDEYRSRVGLLPPPPERLCIVLGYKARLELKPSKYRQRRRPNCRASSGLVPVFARFFTWNMGKLAPSVVDLFRSSGAGIDGRLQDVPFLAPGLQGLDADTLISGLYIQEANALECRGGAHDELKRPKPAFQFTKAGF